jgi:acetyl-CoA carboxylase biotin carboxyl carrier protein
MLGVFYSAPAPDEQPFVKIGDRVKKGDVLCIIEAMKLMNEILAEKEGEIVEVCVENGQIVEFSQVLYRLK